MGHRIAGLVLLVALVGCDEERPARSADDQWDVDQSGEPTLPPPDDGESWSERLRAAGQALSESADVQQQENEERARQRKLEELERKQEELEQRIRRQERGY